MKIIIQDYRVELFATIFAEIPDFCAERALVKALRIHFEDRRSFSFIVANISLAIWSRCHRQYFTLVANLVNCISSQRHCTRRLKGKTNTVCRREAPALSLRKDDENLSRCHPKSLRD